MIKQQTKLNTDKGDLCGGKTMLTSRVKQQVLNCCSEHNKEVMIGYSTETSAWYLVALKNANQMTGGQNRELTLAQMPHPKRHVQFWPPSAGKEHKNWEKFRNIWRRWWKVWSGLHTGNKQVSSDSSAWKKRWLIGDMTRWHKIPSVLKKLVSDQLCVVSSDARSEDHRTKPLRAKITRRM